MSDFPSSEASERAPFVPNPAFAEEWDNPEMTEFKRLEAEDRVAYGKSDEAREWLERFQNSVPPEFTIRLAKKPSDRFSVRVVNLNW